MRGVRRFPCAAVGNSVQQAHSHPMLSITQWVIWATIVCSQWVAFVPLSDEVICDVPFGVSSPLLLIEGHSKRGIRGKEEQADAGRESPSR